MGKNVSWAVIGHGRSPEGRAWGKRIDQYDNVVRMWDHKWQHPSEYGDKYTYGIYEAHQSYLREFVAHNHRDPSKGWIAFMVNNVDARQLPLPEPTLEIVDQAPWVAIGRGFGGVGTTGRLRYTRGTLAGMWTIFTAKRGDSVSLVAFDSIYLRYAQPTDEAFSKAYQGNPGTFSFTHYDRQVSKDHTTTKHGNHDYAVERLVLEHYAKANGVKLDWSQEW